MKKFWYSKQWKPDKTIKTKKSFTDSFQTFDKIIQDAEERLDAITQEAASIQIDVKFIKDVAAWWSGKLFTPNQDTIIEENRQSFGRMLKRQGIRKIVTDERKVLALVLKRVPNNWLFKILTDPNGAKGDNG